MPYKVSGVPCETVADFWPDVLPMLAPAMKIGGDNTTPAELLDMLRGARCALWIVEDIEIVAAMVLHFPHDRDSLMVWLMGGRDFDAWQPVAQPLLQRYARDHGKRYVEAYARPGLAKKLRRDGWRTRYELVAVEANT